MAHYGGLKGILSGLTKSADHPSTLRLFLKASGMPGTSLSTPPVSACRALRPSTLCGTTTAPRRAL